MLMYMCVFECRFVACEIPSHAINTVCLCMASCHVSETYDRAIEKMKKAYNRNVSKMDTTATEGDDEDEEQ